MRSDTPAGRDVSASAGMKYLTTLAVAHQIGVSKQTLLNWLYAGKVTEPPRNKKGYRLWSQARISLIRKLIEEGRINRRTVLHRNASSRADVVAEFAREVGQFLRDAQVDPPAFLRELVRVSPQLAPFVRARQKRRPAAARPATPSAQRSEAARVTAARARHPPEAPRAADPSEPPKSEP